MGEIGGNSAIIAIRPKLMQKIAIVAIVARKPFFDHGLHGWTQMGGKLKR
jgi:hypothetical protein